MINCLVQKDQCWVNEQDYFKQLSNNINSRSFESQNISNLREKIPKQSRDNQLYKSKTRSSETELSTTQEYFFIYKFSIQLHNFAKSWFRIRWITAFE